MSEDGSEGSATPPRPQRRIKKVMVLSSASESESDDSEGPTRTRKRRLRVVSEDEGASSSGSSVGARRRRALPQLRDSDADSDESGGPAPSAPPKPSGFASDSSEGNSDKCSICLMRFTDQEVGTPVNCEHIFCLDCITEWSKNVNTCPVDRITFDSIVVRTCAGGRVLRSDPVQVLERRPSVEMLVIEDPTVCEICGSMENEDSMLLCDGCDLGFHMQCLTPPILEIPIEQWHCPSCISRGLHNIGSLEDIIYLSEVDDLFTGIADMEMPRGPRPAPLRQPREVRRSSRNQAEEPSTSSGRRGAPTDAPVATRGARTRVPRAPPRRRRKPTRRRTKTVIIEYEIEENGKFPITRRVKKTVRKRKIRKRRPRTAARRTLVRASVRAQLAALAAPALPTVTAGVAELHTRRARAGIPTLNLFGSERDLDYFSDDDNEAVSEGASTAVARAARPNASVFSAYRQARRKMISVPSPPHATAAPDLLSDILESQTLLHSRRSVVSVAVDGQISVKLRGEGRVDVSKGTGPLRSAPAHGQRGGWGGGYSGNYHREQSANNFGRGYEYGPNGGDNNYPARGNNYSGGRREEQAWGAGGRLEPACARPRRPEPRPQPPHRSSMDSRHSLGPSWPRQRAEPPGRHSFGGFDNPLDMRVAPGPAERPFRPLPEPPVFNFDKLPEEKSEDGSDSSLVIDTEKYDPTEPTNDDDDEAEPAPVFGPLPAPPAPPPLESPPKTPPPALPTTAPLPSTPLPPAPLVPAGLLDTAVRQVLQEHRALMEPSQVNSDEDSDGDCPNFSIYSATSVHIASAGSLAPPTVRPQPDMDMSDLVQEDDEPPNTPEPPTPTKKDDYKEKVSKRCPITPNTRDPIKIKLNTPSLIKRVSLYDDEDVAEPTEEANTESNTEPDAPESAVEEMKTSDDPPEPEDDKDNEGEIPIDEKKDEEDGEGEEKEEEEEQEKEEKKSDDEESADEAKRQTPSPKEDKTPDRETEETEEVEKQNGVASPHSERSQHSEQSQHSAHSTHSPQYDEGSDRELGVIADTEPGEAPEKMTESISETEDERSYTPCLDENQSKDDLRLEGEALGTELISEDEANGVFSDAAGSPPPEPDGKKKKKKEGKKDGKTKSKGKKDVGFRKISKAGRERTYRDKDRRRRSGSGSPRRAASERRRREKRKDLERYDVRSVVTEKRKKLKDPFGRDVSPARSASRSPRVERRSLSRPRRSTSRPRRSISRPRRSVSRVRRSLSHVRRSISRPRRSLSRPKRSPSRVRLTPSPRLRRLSLRSLTPLSPRGSPPRRSVSPRRARARRKSASPRRRAAPRRREPEPARARKRRRSASPKPKPGKKKKRVRSPPAVRRPEPRRKSPKRKKKRRSPSRSPALSGAPAGWSPLSVDSRLLSPRTPPPDASPPRRLGKRKRKEPRRERVKHKRGKDQPAPSKEVFTSGDNILVSVSFAEQQKTATPAEKRKHREARREKRKRRRQPPATEDSAKPVAIIDLERSPFRELTPSPKNVIVLSDSDHGEKEPAVPAVAEPAPAAPAFAPGAVGPKTPPEPAAQPAPAPVKFSLAAKPGAAPRAPNPLREEEEPAPAEAEAGPNTPPEPPDSPDAYDPFEPTRSASASPARAASPAAAEPSPERPSMTLEAAQRTNLSADEVIARRPISPIEKVMALLQSTRDESPEPVPASAHLAAPATPAPPPAPRILLPEPARPQPKLFLAKPSPIKSNPIKPMQATKISMLPLPRHEGGDSPYSPGSSDFGDLFSPPPAGKRDAFDTLFGAKPIKRKDKSHAAKVPVKFNRKKGKTQVGVKLDDDNLKILDELPSSAVEMQVKSKFLKKLNRQERVVEEVKLVLKPHYTRKRVSKEEYKDILRRAVPKICHNKTGEINPAKIQALVEAYVKKARKKHKLGLA